MTQTKERTMTNRLVLYFVGLFIMTVGIAISVKSDLGVSPVSSIPYTLTRCWGIEMGKATILFHAALVALQWVILRRNFPLKSLLQVPVGIVFGYFTTFCNYLMTFLPPVDNLPVRIGMILISAGLIAFGIFLYMPADIVPLAGEGTMKAIADTTGIDFARVKIGFDVSMVMISLVTCLIVIHSIGSVGIGTLIAMFLVGIILGQINKLHARILRRRALEE